MLTRFITRTYRDMSEAKACHSVFYSAFPSLNWTLIFVRPVANQTPHPDQAKNDMTAGLNQALHFARHGTQGSNQTGSKLLPLFQTKQCLDIRHSLQGATSTGIFYMYMLLKNNNIYCNDFSWQIQWHNLCLTNLNS